MQAAVESEVPPDGRHLVPISDTAWLLESRAVKGGSVLPGHVRRVLCADAREARAVSGGLAGGENGGPWLDEHEDC